ncbi:GDSL-type esterase/lipase family protein [Aestuariispira insulae]|uniref:Lysophospholipase L1-like esterase n=1 Tax=Aestuariispira insulae TaxID=1461337 RepID=A0A3D9HEW3_9PROT|nr:GDSL-type esterase/lipase family protein [Aestuariispira insulae]RED48019.1 lysophospholipase L1-like esterase [Aestuariispira insulae]
MSLRRICFVGDSVTNGTGDADCRGWPGRLSAAEITANGHDLTCYNLGVRAETSSQIRDRWQDECRARLPGHVPAGITFMFGLNDIADEQDSRRVSLAQSLENAEAVLTASAATWPVLWLGPTPVRRDNPKISPGKGITYRFHADRVTELNARFSTLAKRLDIPYLDCHGHLADTPEWDHSLNEGDGVHPTGAGYEFLSRLIENWRPWRRWFD